ncbi:30S ribosomal protein S12 methylthiotransferase RimO [Clostridium grantii]|uniref:Ribosomal protein uS12 methylthiotransferase RimO n=1 Tax=Clostridium grantii DSM 8605 TaxID=1121316 RepID=A0A1M5QYU1_9CLOT|nr:30S ribosomal protein S12 methylthiotransferase RimO [Clostridium grantii]SHH18703.1 SSU ribosomal protein S12P methylthiotransferase [Clostridium grantii DSM 8605]
MTKLKVGLISLGCDKNRIDSEIVLGKLAGDYEITNNSNEADILIVNTCGFIESSKQESIDTILEMAEYKKGRCKFLIATGCLTQRYKEELTELIPELDLMLGVNDYEKIGEYIKEALEEKGYVNTFNYSDTNINKGERILTTPNHYAYIRISEGCDNNCTYCIIPKIRGKYRSRAMEDILKEAKSLAKQGVKELILVAQDTTVYGIDLYKEKLLHKLLNELSQVEGIEWLRILYCYPEEIYDELIYEIRDNNKVSKYLDMPIQHISNDVLKRMNRRTTKEQIWEKINKLRKEVKDIALRTSLIVGFPGETEEEFSELLSFVEEVKFDNLGVFTYSQEEDTPAAKMKKQVSEEMKEVRYGIIMETQQIISKEVNADKIGKTYEVLVEGRNQENWIGRSGQMAPDIDGTILFSCDKELELGQLVNVKISETLDYDLIGDVEDESCK